MIWRKLPFAPRSVTLWMALSLLPAMSHPALARQVDEGCTADGCTSDDGTTGDCEGGDCEGGSCGKCRGRVCRRGGHGGSGGPAGGNVLTGGVQPYVAPLPVPERGGSTYITYPPVAPHEFLSPHSRVYRTDFADGSYTKTKVSWSWYPWHQHIGCGPRVLPVPQRGQHLSNYWRLGYWGVDGRGGWGQNGMWR